MGDHMGSVGDMGGMGDMGESSFLTQQEVNMGDMGNVGNMGDMGGMGESSFLTQQEVNMGDNMGNVGDMGDMGDMGNVGDMGDMGDMGESSFLTQQEVKCAEFVIGFHGWHAVRPFVTERDGEVPFQQLMNGASGTWVNGGDEGGRWGGGG